MKDSWIYATDSVLGEYFQVCTVQADEDIPQANLCSWSLVLRVSWLFRSCSLTFSDATCHVGSCLSRSGQRTCRYLVMYLFSKPVVVSNGMQMHAHIHVHMCRHRHTHTHPHPHPPTHILTQLFTSFTCFQGRENVSLRQDLPYIADWALIRSNKIKSFAHVSLEHAQCLSFFSFFRCCCFVVFDSHGKCGSV